MHAVSLTGNRYQCRRGDFAGSLVAHQFTERTNAAASAHQGAA